MSNSIQVMFAQIARRYDLANNVLSFGLHHYWRYAASKEIDALKEGTLVLDLCCGTGDWAIAIAKKFGRRVSIIGLDFVREMLDIAAIKCDSLENRPNLMKADAAAIPLADGVVDYATIGFGIRNVLKREECLCEIHRVLRSGGKLLVLEFGKPRCRVIATLYSFYCKFILPNIGMFLTGNRSAYEYLPKSSLAFPSGTEFLDILAAANFKEVKSKAFLGGICYFYVVEKI